MLRLLSSHGFHGLWKCSERVASSATKRKTRSSVLKLNSTYHHRLHVLSRHFGVGSSVWKDALQPKRDKSEEIQTIDLDRWKTIMRSQTTFEEKQRKNVEHESNVDNENFQKQGDNVQDTSLLEATRDLVVMWRQAGKAVPEEITDEEVQVLADLTTKSSKKKYLKYLAIKEAHKRVRKEKQQKKKAEKEASMEQSRAQDSDVEDGTEQKGPELKNTFLLQFWSRSQDKLLAWRSAQAMVFGQPLVFDMSYESGMSRREVENTVSQLMEVEGCNRRSTDPFHLHFCNLQPDSHYQQELLKRYGAEAWDRLLITSTDRQHVDVFPHEQLVYLTADSPNVLRTFDHSKIYIIGSLVDRSIQSGLSLANAKRLKLATARLPLDEFLHWEMGAKNLTLDQMIRIMITIKETGKWEEALKFVPKRKHDGFHQKQTLKESSNMRVKGLSKLGSSEEGDRRLKSAERTFKDERQRFYNPHNKLGLTGRDRMISPSSDRETKAFATRVRTSFKNGTEGRGGSGKNKKWWDNK
ncbi:uncharacterized protein V6R79_017382 [Siganus canaliculatus]